MSNSDLTVNLIGNSRSLVDALTQSALRLTSFSRDADKAGRSMEKAGAESEIAAKVMDEALDGASERAAVLAHELDNVSDKEKKVGAEAALLFTGAWSSRTTNYINKLEQFKAATADEGSEVNKLRKKLQAYGRDLDDTGRIVKVGSKDAEEAVSWWMKVGSSIGDFATKADQAGASMIPMVGALSSLLIMLPILAVAAVVAADGLGTLVAIAASFVAPLSIVAGLLGGGVVVGVLALKRALSGTNPAFNKFQGLVKSIGHGFSVFIGDVARRLAPTFVAIAQSIEPVIALLQRMAHLPLDSALALFGKKGPAAVSHFIGEVTKAFSKPLKMIVNFAFGPQGAGFRAMIDGEFEKAKNYLFGKTRTVKDPHSKTGVSQVRDPGLLDPIIKYFNSQDFTKKGQQIGHKMGAAFASGFLSGVGDSLWSDLKDGFFLVLNGMEHGVQRFEQYLKGHVGDKAIMSMLGHAWSWVKNKAEQVWQSIKGIGSKAATGIGNSVRRAVGAAWDWVRGKATGVWNSIRSIAGNAASGAGNRIRSLIGSAWDFIRAKSTAVWNSIKGLASGAANWAGNSIRGAVGGAFDWLVGKAQGIWDTIKGIFSEVIHVHISLPSLNPLSYFGATGGIVTKPTLSVIGEAGPEMVVPLNRAPGASPLPSLHGMHGGGAQVVNHYHIAGSLISEKELDRRILAGVRNQVRIGNGIRQQNGANIR